MLLAGLLLATMGGCLMWGVLGGAEFQGNIGRTMSFADRLLLSGGILAAGMGLIMLARRSARRLAEKIKREE